MVQITPFKCFYPLSLTDFTLPTIHSDIELTSDVQSIDDSQVLKIPANVATDDHKRIFEEILTLGHSRKYEALSKHWQSYETLGFFKEETDELLYVYKMEYTLGGIKYQQTGLICCLELKRGTIFGHENTLEDKIRDQVKRLETQRISISPIFLLYNDESEIKQNLDSDGVKGNNLSEILDKITFSFPIIDLIATNQVRHTVWKITSSKVTKEIINLFSHKQKIYVADGHHRIESSFLLRDKLRKSNINHTGNENYNYILTAIFPTSQAHILEYNRIVKNVKKFKKEVFPKLKSNFKVLEIPDYEKPVTQDQFLIYTKNKWYKAKVKEKVKQKLSNDSEKLSSFIIQKYVFRDIFKIKDVRNSKRLLYVPGNKPISELIENTDEENGVAFILPPVQIGDIIKIADQRQVVPPKTTWFEPKMLKGIMFWKF